MEPNQTQEKSNGALVGLAIIVIILIIGGIYIWQMKINKGQTEIETTTGEPVPQVETVTEEDATSLDSLNQELESTDTSTGVDVNTVN